MLFGDFVGLHPKRFVLRLVLLLAHRGRDDKHGVDAEEIGDLERGRHVDRVPSFLVLTDRRACHVQQAGERALVLDLVGLDDDLHPLACGFHGRILA